MLSERSERDNKGFVKMAVFEVGRVCMKIAGRDARKKCVVVDVLDNTYVIIDGETRRRKCNILHLEPLNLAVGIKANAGNEEVVKALKEEGIVCDAKKESKKQAQARPKKQKAKKKTAAPAKKVKAEAKPAEKKEVKAEAKPKAAKKKE